MPSGAKKRKAAKKKLQKETKNTINDDGSHSLGNENANKSQDERESDTGEGERESSEERIAEEVSLGERNVSEEVKSEDNYNDVKVNIDDRAIKNRAHKKPSSSSSSSSSDDDAVAVKKDKPKVDEAFGENPVSVEERIPIEESVKKTQEKIETKVIQVVDEGESLLPESSGVISAAAQCGDNHVKDSETHKYVEEEPLVSNAPLPVRRTSWTNCCGLFEVFSGGANR